jgi:hypothetical protein
MSHSQPTHATAKISWSQVKSKISDFKNSELIELLQALYSLSPDNQHFIHTRLELGGDVLKSYKSAIDRWLYPDVRKNQDHSVAKAKKAIADYKKASGQNVNVTELMVFYCERATAFSDDFGFADESFFNALVRMFEQALLSMQALSETQRSSFIARLIEVCKTCHNFGYGVGDDMDGFLDQHGAQ